MEVYSLKLIKRVFDILLSFIAIILLSPLLFILTIAIKVDSRGPALFRQGRLNKYGKVFTIYKFRTMVENAEQMGTGLFNYADDFRVTNVGKYLRKTSLDELPQLFNIIKGDMSIVGPRPPVTYELGEYEDLSDEYKRRFTVLPGITGLAQVCGRNEISWDEKVKYDNHYIDLFKKYGVLLDFKIIFLTVFSVFKMKDIYEVKEEGTEGLSDEQIAKRAADSITKKAQISQE
jgi:lipopolysaccharide/colanic/teichoic acid biosynthesis glycosyltransferase